MTVPTAIPSLSSCTIRGKFWRFFYLLLWFWMNFNKIKALLQIRVRIGCCSLGTPGSRAGILGWAFGILSPRSCTHSPVV